LPLTHIVATCPLITGLISQSNLGGGGHWGYKPKLEQQTEKAKTK
jgi:hypothetical protein